MERKLEMLKIEALQVVVGIAAGLAITTVLILISLLFMSWIQNNRKKRQERFYAEWEPLLAEASLGSEQMPPLPSLRRRDYISFLLVWNRFQQNLRVESRWGLLQMATDLGMNQVAARMMKRRDETGKALAALTLGNLKDYTRWHLLQTMAERESGLCAQIAAGALAKIDPLRAAPILIPLFVERHEWPQTRVAAILGEMGSSIVSEPLVDAIRKAEEADIPRLLRYIPFIEPHAAVLLVRELLANRDNSEVIAACLIAVRYLEDHKSKDVVINLLDHPGWAVRVQAVNALGRLAGTGDVDHLSRMLSDSNWWVRYRSAQALVGLPFMDPKKLENIKEGQSDRYARDIMAQVIGEEGIGDSR
ncbi:MAG: HEAT repeat domain-containing protein [Syntrophomonadaceae bacterium]|nr:HEAT repeat domain-containing protein [Syntrophomonadaceae bacterium]